jgi:molybdopterin-binding protein
MPCWHEEAFMTLSARNHLKGIVDEVQLGDILAHITVRVGDSVIESVITRRSAEELGLKKGDSVTAVVKATEVMISKP